MERRKKRAVEHQLTTSRSSSRGSFLLGYQRKTCAHFNLSREYQTLTYSLDFFIIKNWHLETGRHLSPVGGGIEGWTIQMVTMVISNATNMKIAAQKAALQNLRS